MKALYFVLSFLGVFGCAQNQNNSIDSADVRTNYIDESRNWADLDELAPIENPLAIVPCN